MGRWVNGWLLDRWMVRYLDGRVGEWAVERWGDGEMDGWMGWIER